MGELEEHVFTIGSPDIDIMMSKDLPSKEELNQYYDIPFKNYAILIFHPVTTELKNLENQTKELISAAIDSKKNYVVIYPNNDPGSDIILKTYEQFQNNKSFRIYPSLRFEYFLTLLKNTDFIIGNSSSGITEAEIYNIPTINVGTRQKNRSNNKNIINVVSNKGKILDAILKIDGKKIETSCEFGDGESTKRFFEVMTDKKNWEIPIQKYFVETKQ